METTTENTEKHPSEDFFGELKSAALKHFSNKLELTKLTVIEIGARIAGLLTALVVVSIILFFFLGYASFLLGLFLSEKMGGNYFYGFGSVSIALLVLMVVVFTFRKPWIEIPVSNQIIKIIFDNQYEEDTRHKEPAERP